MKKLTLNSAWLFALVLTLLTGCSKEEVAPKDAGAASNAQDSTLPLTHLVKSYIFLRTPGPLNMGHTGVGYEVREMRGSTVTKVYTYCGGVEGASWIWGVPAAVIRPGDPNGGWREYHLNSNVAMLNKMRSMGYNSYKFETGFRNIAQSDLTGAANMIRDFPNRGYRVAENNCANAVYDVLLWLRAPGLVAPFFRWFPNDQFNGMGAGWSGARAL